MDEKKPIDLLFELENGITAFPQKNVLVALNFLVFCFALAGVTEYWEIYAAVAIFVLMYYGSSTPGDMLESISTALGASHNFLAGVKLNQNKNRMQSLQDILLTIFANVWQRNDAFIKLFMINMGFSVSHMAKNDPILTKSLNYLTGKVLGAFSRKKAKQSRRTSKRKKLKRLK